MREPMEHVVFMSDRLREVARTETDPQRLRDAILQAAEQIEAEHADACVAYDAADSYRRWAIALGVMATFGMVYTITNLVRIYFAE